MKKTMIALAVMMATTTFANAQSEKTTATKKVTKTECCEKADKAKSECCKDKKTCCKAKTNVDATTSATTQAAQSTTKATKATKAKKAKKTVKIKATSTK